MIFFRYYYYRVLRRDLLTKYFYNNVFQLPKLQKIVLSFSVSQASLKSLLPLLSAMNLVAGQRPCVVTSKSLHISLKMKTGLPVGCKVDIRGKDKFLFLEKLVFFVVPHFKEILISLRKNVFFFSVPSLFVFKELEKEYDYFLNLPKLTVSLIFNKGIRSELVDFLIASGLPLTVEEVK